MVVAVVATLRRKFRVALAGVAVAGVGLALPARTSRSARVESRLDELMPEWQFNEVHTLRIDAPPAVVFDAIRNVRADEIRLFQTLTWIRRGGRQLPEGILNPGNTEPLLDVATRSGFAYLAIEEPREVVVGTIIFAPRGADRSVTRKLFLEPIPRGFAIAAMNFRVTADGRGSLVTTETRVLANHARAKRRFAAYWRVIYPGSALIRRMWLRAIDRRSHAFSSLREVRTS
ncbi:MAG TPA: hypothetical protein VF846_10510 [Thermoanaerobaculia bacterium]